MDRTCFMIWMLEIVMIIRNSNIMFSESVREMFI